MKGLARGQAAAQTLLPTGAAALLVAAIGYVVLPWRMGQGGDFLVLGPDITQIDRLASRVITDRFAVKIDQHRASQSAGHHHGR